MLLAPPMRHYPAYCSDCKRLWLVATDSAPSASPTCPGCGERGRLVPGAYYSDAASTVFDQIERAVHTRQLKTKRLGQLAIELEQLLPTPSEQEIEAAFDSAVQELGFSLDALPWASAGVGKRVALRMLVTIASTRSQPVVRESGVLRLPQTIPGLFDPVPKKRATTERPSAAPGATPAEADPDSSDAGGSQR
ncbi:MAG TPA: hypothetical protein VIW29_17685 [Polyangiaceae bacterium]